MMCCSLVLGHVASVSSLRGNIPLLRDYTYNFLYLIAPLQPGPVPWHRGGRNSCTLPPQDLDLQLLTLC